MLFSTTTRSLAPKCISLAARQQVVANNKTSIRLLSSVAPPSSSSKPNTTAYPTTREIHIDQPNLQYVAPMPTYYPEGSTAKEAPKEEEESSGMLDRFKVTAEVAISKIFPAGLGWQSSSIVAEDMLGYTPDSVAFALTTGFGDAVGVMLGHCAFYAAKKSITGDESINMERETQTGLLLASAAFCSGMAWQPLVDMLQAAELPFFQVFAGTWVGCGTAFYLGLRGSRTILSGPCKYIHEPTYENSTTDKSLSVAIGGATGFFIGTDAAYLPTQNFLLPVVGIHDTTPALVGCALAGTSTSLGFTAAQTTLNLIYPKDKLWNDGK